MASMSTTEIRPMGNPRAEAHFVASGLPDSLRPAVSAEAHFLMNVCGFRFSDAVFSACQCAPRNDWGSKIAASLAAQAAS
jgi:hypothetical protein